MYGKVASNISDLTRLSRYKLPQNNGRFTTEDARASPDAKNYNNDDNDPAKTFDEKFRELVLAALGTPQDTQDQADIVRNLEKTSTKALFDPVIEAYKIMQPEFSKKKWKQTIANEVEARKGQRRQIQAVEAIERILKDSMEGATKMMEGDGKKKGVDSKQTEMESAS
ncbi:uncharacterized protein RCC_03476 [Ramularia collo-cygni]|uniref:Uncharacterized protein n=1 Tax=Ramularia collo-cygni TaxID=112498 RepID=A0A2D3V823_9PEZI|nr:uncharacterized protein RCC_03476 [Ramularia collo-cygni]CZT17639.1 uncharacterized protein RCC_03476 [Ramularia collo-cygni]